MVFRLIRGHGKVPRTFGTKDHFPGAVVTYAVMHQLEKIAKAKPNKLKIVTSATVSKLITESRPWLLSGTCAFAHSSLLGMEEVGVR
mmetsp:Transcript_18058/g.39766  ORF Transcript_18058/g.39766 Transcript_18058/m.39766 type:complete len:87 (+) Transcript_18058:395-655(+)